MESALQKSQGVAPRFVRRLAMIGEGVVVVVVVVKVLCWIGKAVFGVLELQ